MRYEGEIDGTAIFSYLLNPSLESVVGQVVSGCVWLLPMSTRLLA